MQQGDLLAAHTPSVHGHVADCPAWPTRYRNSFRSQHPPYVMRISCSWPQSVTVIEARAVLLEQLPEHGYVLARLRRGRLQRWNYALQTVPHDAPLCEIKLQYTLLVIDQTLAKVADAEPVTSEGDE